MDSFEKLIETILIDITKAQHQANKYSARLAKQYQDDLALSFFPVPNAAVREFEFKLKFGIEAVIDDAGEGNLPQMPLWSELVSMVGGAVRNLFAVLESEPLKLDRLLGAEGATQWSTYESVFESSVQLAIWKELQESLIHQPDTDRQRVVERLGDTAAAALVKTMDSLVDEVPTEWIAHLRERARQIFERALPEPWNQVQSQTRDLKVNYNLEFSAGVDGDALASCTLHVDMRNYEWATDAKKNISPDGSYSRLLRSSNNG